MNNPFTSRFALGDKVIAGHHPKEECEVVGVIFRAGKVAYEVRFATDASGRPMEFDSCDVDPAQACGIAGVADDCAPFGINPQKWVLAAMASKRIPRDDEGPNMHTVGLPQG